MVQSRVMVLLAVDEFCWLCFHVSAQPSFDRQRVLRFAVIRIKRLIYIE